MKTFVSYHLQWHFFPVILTKGPTDCVTSRVCYRELFCPSHSVVSNSVTPWMEDRQAPLSMGFSRQEYWSEPKAFSFQCMTEFTTKKKKKEYWSGLPFPAPGDLPDQGLNPRLLHLLHPQVDSLPCVT